MHEASLTSLAILKVNWDEKGQDYVENFVPFIVEALKSAPQNEVSVSWLQGYIRETFGLVIPQGALNTLLHRAQRHEYVRREHGIYLRTERVIESNFSQIRNSVDRQHQALITKLIEFCKEKHNVTWSPEDAEKALLTHLQKSCIPILAASVDGCAIPLPQTQAANAEFLVSAFTIHLYESDPEGFAFLETVMKGSMLANMLMLPDIAKTNQKFKKLRVFLDTRILLRALGLEGESLKTYCDEFLNLLYESNVDLACFDITIDELRGILDAAQNALKDRNHIRKGMFSVYEHFVSQGSRASDVELIIAGLEKSIRKLRVHIKTRPPHTIVLDLNENRLQKILHEYLPEQREEAQHHDIDCLTAIHRLRKGQPKNEIETCEYVFITTNNELATASARFFIEEYGRSTVPLCINDHTLATLAWVKNPSVTQDFSRSRLIADSYAALEPSLPLWRKYLQEVARLQEHGGISNEDYDLLRFSMVARNALLEATLGSPDAFTEGTVREILEAARADARKETEQELAREQQKRQTAESRAKTAEALLDESLRSQRERFKGIANTTAAWLKYGMHVVVSSLMVIGVYATLPEPFPKLPKDWNSAIIPLAIAVFFVQTLWSLISGGTVRALARTFRGMGRARNRKVVNQAFWFEDYYRKK